MKPENYHELLAAEKARRMEIEQDLQLRLRQQEAIARLGEFALGCHDLDSLFAECVRGVADTLDMEMCKVLQLLPGGDSLLLRAGVGWMEGLVGSATVGTDLDSQAGYTLMTEEPVIVDDLREEKRFSGPELLRNHNVISGMSVVIPGNNGPFGVLGTHTSRRRIFHAHDTRFIKAIASILATAIQRFSAEDALRRSRNELEIILQGISEGVTVQDKLGKLVYANQTAAEMMGFQTVEEALTANLAELQRRFILLDEAGVPYSFEKLPGRLVLQGNSQAAAKVRFRILASGEERWSIVEATPIFDAAGKPIQAINIFRDITEMVLAEQTQRFLAEVGTLLTSSLEYEHTLQHVAKLAVTNLADWCSITILSDPETLRTLSVAHKDPAMMELAEAYQKRYPPDLNASKGLAEVLRTGKPAFYPVISDAMLEQTARDPEHLEIIRALGMRSAIIAPLVARGRTLGAISLIWAESGRTATTRDLELSVELARRAALAIDNARLYREVQAANADLEKRVADRTHELVQSNRQLEREIEERRKTEQALRGSEEMLRSLFESAPDATLLVDQSGMISRVNEQAERLFGYSRDELLGTPIDQLLPERFRRAHFGKRQGYMKAMTTRTMGAGLELFALTKEGVEIPVDVMLSPVRTEAGEMIICAIRNISEQKRLQAELTETHRRLFESVEAERLRISRDLHDGPIQDLYGVALYLETLRDLIPNARQLEEFSETMGNIQLIIQGLREICGELRPPILEQFGLERAIRSHLARVRDSHPEIAFEARLMSDGLALSERTRLALFRVYQTAISNVIRHARASRVWLDFRVEEGEIRLEIRDNGRGFNVPGKWIELAREGHFGLVGMAERVESLGGQLFVESEIDRGTFVRLIVPLDSSLMSTEVA